MKSVYNNKKQIQLFLLLQFWSFFLLNSLNSKPLFIWWVILISWVNTNYGQLWKHLYIFIFTYSSLCILSLCIFSLYIHLYVFIFMYPFFIYSSLIKILYIFIFNKDSLYIHLYVSFLCVYSSLRIQPWLIEHIQWILSIYVFQLKVFNELLYWKEGWVV